MYDRAREPLVISSTGVSVVLLLTPALRKVYLEVAASNAAVPSVRLFTRTTVDEWGLAKLADDVELVVSELVTNAVQATLDRELGSNVAMVLAETDGELLVLVWDGATEVPEPASPDSDGLHGRGLQIVAALASRWGTALGENGGKVVWAVVALG